MLTPAGIFCPHISIFALRPSSFVFPLRLGVLAGKTYRPPPTMCLYLAQRTEVKWQGFKGTESPLKTVFSFIFNPELQLVGLHSVSPLHSDHRGRKGNSSVEYFSPRRRKMKPALPPDPTLIVPILSLVALRSLCFFLVRSVPICVDQCLCFV